MFEFQFRNYNPSAPFPVTETKTIENDCITLDYAPLEGSVSIDGFRENMDGSRLALYEFSINYNSIDNYRQADQVVRFSDGAHNGTVVTIVYQGVSTLLRAEHLNAMVAEIAAMGRKLKEILQQMPEHVPITRDEIDELFGVGGGSGDDDTDVIDDIVKGSLPDGWEATDGEAGAIEIDPIVENPYDLPADWNAQDDELTSDDIDEAVEPAKDATTI